MLSRPRKIRRFRWPLPAPGAHDRPDKATRLRNRMTGLGQKAKSPGDRTTSALPPNNGHHGDKSPYPFRGTFETYRSVLRMSGYRARSEVIGARSERRF